jgi:hypothetical protein
MRLAWAAVLVAGVVGYSEATPKADQAADQLGAKASVVLADVSREQLMGTWAEGGVPGLSGSNLYLFPDGSYVYTEWADVLPETIYDKGRWKCALGVLALVPDADITSDPKTHRRYLVLQLRGAAGNAEPHTVLLGAEADESLGLLGREPADVVGYLEPCAFRRTPWSRGEAAKVKARFGKGSPSWRPCFFTPDGCRKQGVNAGK